MAVDDDYDWHGGSWPHISGTALFILMFIAGVCIVVIVCLIRLIIYGFLDASGNPSKRSYYREDNDSLCSTNTLPSIVPRATPNQQHNGFPPHILASSHQVTVDITPGIDNRGYYPSASQVLQNGDDSNLPPSYQEAMAASNAELNKIPPVQRY